MNPLSLFLVCVVGASAAIATSEAIDPSSSCDSPVTPRRTADDPAFATVAFAGHREATAAWRLSPAFDVLDWGAIATFADYRRAAAPLAAPALASFYDKIWLHQFFVARGIRGAPIAFAARAPEARVPGALEAALAGMGGTYCAKAAHLSYTVGVLLVRDGVLLQDVFFAPDGGTARRPGSAIAAPGLAGVPEKFRRAFKRGRRVEEAEAAAFLRFLLGQTATWSPASLQAVPPGVVVEHLRPGEEMKVLVGMGEPLGFFVPAQLGAAADADPTWTAGGGGGAVERALALAATTAAAAGAPFARVDIVRDHTGALCVSEFDWVPARNKSTLRVVTAEVWQELRGKMQRLLAARSVRAHLD